MSLDPSQSHQQQGQVVVAAAIVLLLLHHQLQHQLPLHQKLLLHRQVAVPPYTNNVVDSNGRVQRVVNLDRLASSLINGTRSVCETRVTILLLLDLSSKAQQAVSNGEKGFISQHVHTLTSICLLNHRLYIVNVLVPLPVTSCYLLSAHQLILFRTKIFAPEEVPILAGQRRYCMLSTAIVCCHSCVYDYQPFSKSN